MKYFILIMLFSTLLLSCSGNKKYDNVSSLDKNDDLYVIDIDKIEKEDFINMSDYFKNVEVIILETGDDCLIGAIGTLNVVDDFIVIMDDMTKDVYVFHKDGRFSHKIGSRGGGPGEYENIKSSTVDFDKKEIYLYDSPVSKISKYNMITGDYINSIRIHEEGLSYFYIQYIENKMYVSTVPVNKDKEDSFLLQEVNISTGKSTSAYLRASEYNNSWNRFYLRSEGFFYPDNKGGAKYVQMFMDTVVSIDRGGIKPYLALKTKNWVTKKDIRDLIEAEDNSKENVSYDILFERDMSYNIHRYFESDNMICFRYRNHGTSEFVIYDKNTKKTRVSKEFMDNIVYKGNGFSYHLFAFADSKGVYNYVDTHQMAGFLNIVNFGGLNLNPEVQAKLKNLSDDANPIIFYYERK
jgi:hypothetical protein